MALAGCLHTDHPHAPIFGTSSAIDISGKRRLTAQGYAADRVLVADAAAELPAAQHRLRLLRAWIATGVWAHVHDVLYRCLQDTNLQGRETD